ncbi:MAG: urease accessory protein UreF [Thioalkalivibrio sp.]
MRMPTDQPRPPVMTPVDAGLARRRLWQLISPTLPVGAYSYSTGLEQAVDAGWVGGLDAVRDWLEAQLLRVQACVDLPALLRLQEAWCQEDGQQLEYWNDWLRASRETAELRAEDLGQGRALARLLADLGVAAAQSWRTREDACWATLFALAGREWAIPSDELLEGYLWSWCENQVAAAVKLVPLGQTQGQRLLWDLAETIAVAVDQARTVDDADMGGGLPGVILSSMLHETQYSRMFRS